MNRNLQVLNGFQYQTVVLEDSLWKDQLDYTVKLYLSLENGDILQSAISHYGLQHQCFHGLPGWGGNLGQFLGAFAKLHRVTGDYRLKAKAISLFEEWAAIVDAHSEVLHNGTYNFDKLIGGFLDMYEFLGYERVEAYISKLTDQVMLDLDRSIDRDGLQDHRMKGQIEWYTLPENLYRAYQCFGDEKYKEYAAEWHYDYLWDKMLAHDFKIGPRHAYSQVNSLSSAARAYEVTGDPKYLDVIRIAYDEITQHHTYATGGYGPGENLFMDREGYLGFMITSPWDLHGDEPGFTNFAGGLTARSDAWGSCEVSCCAWAVFKICNYLLTLTGDAKYGMWAEQLLINGTGGQPDIKPNGELLYYASYFVDGAMKSTVDRRLQRDGENFVWQCCSGTWPQDVAEYANMIYYSDSSSLCISQYLPSTVTWRRGGESTSNSESPELTLRNFSSYPFNENIQFKISVSEPVVCRLKFRVPHWATAKNQLRINGRIEDADIIPNTWLEIEREWQNDDLIEITFPFKLWIKPVDEQHPDIVALNYGPLVLVSTEMTILEGDRDDLDSWIIPVPGEHFTFQTLSGHSGRHHFISRTFVPYITYPEDKWYFMYMQLSNPDEARALSRQINI